MPESGDAGSPAAASAHRLLAGLARRGVRHVVVCPGSRSQALALAAAELDRQGRIRLHVRVDERGAGFFALGAARESGAPAVVITTSGTAVANLHPAVLEAHHSRIPLILLTADRPAELRGRRENQTTVQPGIFGDATRLALDAPAPVGDSTEADATAALASRAIAAATAHRHPGPVHLNLQYREPLSGAVGDEADASDEPDEPDESVDSVDSVEAPAEAEALAALELARGPRTVVIAGDSAGEEAEALARAAGWPLIAEVSSGAHFGPNLVVAYRALLDDEEFGGRVQRAVVLGHPTLSRQVPALLRRAEVEVVVVHAGDGERYDPAGAAAVFAEAVAAPASPPDDDERRWTGRWIAASRGLVDEGDADAPTRTSGVALGGHVEDFAAQRDYVKAEFAAVRAPVTRRMLVEALWQATWPHDRLLLGASRLVRDADAVVPGRRIRVHASRGLAGIDGSVSTALGVAAASQDAGGPGITRALIGDLTLLHDAGSLLIGTTEHRPRVLVVVGNDGGGTIFDTLEVASSAASDDFDRVLHTPQAVDLAALAAAYGWEYRRATTRGELSDALSKAVTGPTLLEVPLPR